MFGIDYFDSILLSGSYQEKGLRELEALRHLPARELVVTGCTYLDVFAGRLEEIPGEEGPFTVLVSPSWGASGLLTCYGERLLDPLVKTGLRIIIRPHPQSAKSETALLERLSKRYGGSANVSWDYERDNIYSLKKADIMITDFSGIIFDYIFLRDKPVLYVNQRFDFRPYDAYFVGGKTWQFSAMEEFGIELREEFFETIGDVIRSASDSPALKAARRRARDTAWQYRGEAGKRAADYMISVVNRA
jgi:CDP-glycerol glycerophosphotransferase (TagB/SpsB family)